MKNFFKIIGVLVLVFFSFFYTEKAITVLNEQDEIMIKLTEAKDKYKKDSVSAIIADDTIIPGIQGKEIDIDKSYKNMKKIGIFNSKLIEYKTINPDISINDNYDKYIIKGNNKFNNVSLIFKVDSDNEYEKVLDIIKYNNIKANIFIDYDYLSQNISNINKNDNYNYYSYGNKGKYTIDILIMSNNVINRKSNNAIYCLNESKNKNNLKVCSENNVYSIMPSIINASYSLVKNNLENGSIISFDINAKGINEINSIIDYINGKGYKIVLLDELLSEDK